MSRHFRTIHPAPIREHFASDADYLKALRDWFAGQAMAQGMNVLVSSQHNLNDHQIGQLARTAYLAADAMIAAMIAERAK